MNPHPITLAPTRHLPTVGEPFTHPMFGSASILAWHGEAGQWLGGGEGPAGQPVQRWLVTADIARRWLHGSSPARETDFASCQFWLVSALTSAASGAGDTEWVDVQPVAGDAELLAAVGPALFAHLIDAARQRGDTVHPAALALLTEQHQEVV